MNIEDYRRHFKDNDVPPGWAAIDRRLTALYGVHEPLWHIAAVPHFAMGGTEPLDGISIYARLEAPQPHLHFVSYGMSRLYYDEDAIGHDSSGFGFEFTFRVVLGAGAQSKKEDGPPAWPLNLMQNLARYVVKSGNWFEAGHYIDAKGPIAQGIGTDLVAAAFTLDPELGAIDTAHGRVEFLQIVGLTGSEYAGIVDGTSKVDEILAGLSAGNPLLITDLARRTVLKR